MAITKLEDGRWFVDVEPIKGKRFRKRFKTKGEAQRFEASVRAKLAVTPEWNPRPKDTRRLSQLIERWYELHGHAITSGRRRRNMLLFIAAKLGNPIAQTFTVSDLVALRKVELEEGALPRSINVRYSYLKSIYTELRRLGDIDYANPLDTLKPLKPQQEVVSFLSKAQVATLVSALRDYSTFPHLALISEICLATGARWSEAQRLTWPMVRAGCVVFANTKSKRVRTVPISQELQDRLEAYFAKKNRFPFCREAFARMVKRCNIVLPRGQCTHVLRHTFASHFMMNGGNILALKEILGHTSLNMTMRYAHLSPEYLQDAVRLNPLSMYEGESIPGAGV
ncbi:tyrosine-type recombinase/integrase [Pseudomonas sp. NPDC086581]|uniref:phage integrase n=1 Tax=Pseudomonas sp. NPDC086581 TaxID=3364432 RepID=UPI0037F71FB0